MSQELESAKYFQQPSRDEMSAYRKRATGSSNWMLATKSVLHLVFWLAMIGGGGFMICNAAMKANQERSGAGAHPAESLLSFCMHLVYLDWDERVEVEIEHSWREDSVSPPEISEVSDVSPSRDAPQLTTELPDPSDYLPRDLFEPLPGTNRH